MKDNEAIKRREKVFEQLRQASTLREKLDAKVHDAQQRMYSVRQELADCDNQINQLSRLIRVMIMHDCCPVEAQLKYADELADSHIAEGPDYGYAEGSVNKGYNIAKPALLSTKSY